MSKKLSLAMGFFDSVHIGHRTLLRKNREYAISNDMIPAVYTFRNDMGEFFGNKQLYDFSIRKKLLSKYAMVISKEFDKKTANFSGERFLYSIIENYDVGAFFCGYDYTFGKGAEWGADELNRFALNQGINCYVMPKETFGNEKISTSRIKKLLLDGLIELADELLGYPYHIVGKVVHGRGVGTSFGLPTANIQFDGFLPKVGVYKTQVEVDGNEYLAVTNVGDKPTFGIDSVSIESMLIDYDGDLYGKEIVVKLLKYIRGIRKFRNGKELHDQITKDIKEALCSE